MESEMFPSIERGFGYREQGALYMCCPPTHELLKNVELSVLDPAWPWSQGDIKESLFFKSVRGQRSYCNAIGKIDKTQYPFVPDFVEEVRQFGFCKKIPIPSAARKKNYVDNYSIIQPHLSFIYLVHDRGRVNTPYKTTEKRNTLPPVSPNILRPQPPFSQWNEKLRQQVPYIRGDCHHDATGRKGITNCTFALWDLSAKHNGRHHKVQTVDMHHAQIHTPSVTYNVALPLGPINPKDINYEAAIFMRIPITHFEYISLEGNMPPHVEHCLGTMKQNTYIVPK